MLCQECPSRSICQSACPELELHLKEIEKPQRELPIGTPRHGRFPRQKKRIKLTTREQQIVRLMAAGRDPIEISQELNITRHNVDSITNRLMSKLR
jgi:DNA-binding NarL/FixJ family response regulator